MAWYQRIWNVLRTERLQRNLARELSFHLQERSEELQAGGMSAEESMSQARRQLGNYTAQIERTRDMDITAWLDAMLRNIRVALRSLRKAPAFTATVILALALGIGANSAVFSAIYAVLLRPLPVPHPDQLVLMTQRMPRTTEQNVAPVRLEEWNRLNGTLQGITGYYVEDASELSGELPEKLRRALVAPRFLQVWGVAPALGRDFAPEEEHWSGPSAVLISDRLWRRRFGAGSDVIGKRLRFGRYSVPIVGVMPASFVFPDRNVDLWSPSPPDAPFAQGRDLTWFRAVGRMKPGVTLAQAQANLEAVQASLGRQYPKTDAEISPVLAPLAETAVGSARRSLWLLFGSVTLLLLIACINVAALLLSRAAGRRHEISVRFSLGGSRMSVAVQLLTEVLILATAGAALGLLLAAGASSVFRALAKSLPRVQEIGLDWRIVVYSLACALAATLLCGILPAIRSTRSDLSGALAEAGRSQVAGRNRVQLALVAAQVALAVTLLAGAGLLLRSFQQLGRVSPGFDAGNVLTFQVSSTWAETADLKAAQQRVERILDALRALPGVDGAATSITLPGLPAEYQTELKIQDGSRDPNSRIMAQNRLVTPGYFQAMHIPLLAGETCRIEANASSMMVNRSFANAYLGGAFTGGQHVLQPGNNYVPPSEIHGIVGDARETGLDHEPVPTVYWCFGATQPGTYFLVRTHNDPMALAEAVRRRIHDVEPLRSVYDVASLESRISDAYSASRLRTILLVFFALTAVTLACIGLYGTLSYIVNVRQREVGLRMALGAVRPRIVRQFLTQGLLVSAIGCAAGLGMAAAFTRVLSGMLYGVSTSDAVTLAGVPVLVLAVSAMASLLPALRAARLDPMRVLREE